MRLQVHSNGRYLQYEDGKPFFYLGDTAWELFHRLSREDADYYLETRAAQGFTVIQAVALAEHEFERPNAYGDLPLHDNDPLRLNEAYFAHVDYIVQRCAALGLTVGMLPTWGDKWNRKWGVGPELFTQENAQAYGELLGKRYRDSPIIWILGGDRPVETDAQREIIRAMAVGLDAGDGGAHLMTFHPPGGMTSSSLFHTEEWLDFNMYQTGHNADRNNGPRIRADYDLQPVKPIVDGEPGYEDHPNGFKPENGYLTATDTRKYAYWALFAGAFGHTYGCHDIWQFLQAGWRPVTSPRTPWVEAIHLAGANQMRHARRLLESRSFFTRIPDNTLLKETDDGRICATRDLLGAFALVFSPDGKPFCVDLSHLEGALLAAWYDPRTGKSHEIGTFQSVGEREFTPPSTATALDWVLTLDRA